MTARLSLRRSFDVYYRDADRAARMDRLNAMFVGPGDRAFDIGAHVGDRTASFRRLGASVVAVEPQPRVFRALRLIHGRDPLVDLHCAAVGNATGWLDLHVNTRNPTVSTVSRDMIAAASQDANWHGQHWDETIRVPVTTLTALIRRNGPPEFIKIDVEGHELDVLNGLDRPVRALSFEFTTIQKDIALACVARITAIGAYQFNYSLGEDHHLRLPDWCDADAMAAILHALPGDANSGDVYCRVMR
ncbi:FkbM family methyltransferase [Marivita sp. S6314]|uniref:FkbM family methyltransferase n=1 Tax=Marivita sp. S6314 TaxID=2926406 RepID=UPI001FF1D423|nr:FkbM family methyltransferase [Marivita sp. S6314]MCK0149458.1 FkbM family methyltransferase [Marivita sp. S6314]